MVMLTLDVSRSRGPDPDFLLSGCFGPVVCFLTLTVQTPEGSQREFPGCREKHSKADSQARGNKRKTNPFDFLKIGSSLVVQWLGFRAFTVRGLDSIPGRGTKIPQALQPKRLLWWLRGKESVCNAGDVGDSGSIPGLGRSPGGGNGNPLILAREIPWIEESRGLQSVESQRVGHN